MFLNVNDYLLVQLKVIMTLCDRNKGTRDCFYATL